MSNFMDTPVGLLAFLSIFHLIGGIALGMTFNRIVRERRLGGQSIFFIVWGGMFGCMPLTFGSQSEPWVLAAQIGILALAIGIPFAIGGSLREGFQLKGVQNVLFGGIFLVVGFLVTPVSLLLAVQMLAGIILAHAERGFYVVGPRASGGIHRFFCSSVPKASSG